MKKKAVECGGSIESARMAERLTRSPAERLYSGSNPDPGFENLN